MKFTKFFPHEIFYPRNIPPIRYHATHLEGFKCYKETNLLDNSKHLYVEKYSCEAYG